MIYSINHGIGWASSGVEYAQAYRARMFRLIGREAKFIFTDMFPVENIEHMTRNIGFRDEEVIWLYQFFTGCRTAPVSFTLADLEETFGNGDYTFTRDGAVCRYTFGGSGVYYSVYLTGKDTELVHRVEMVCNGCLIRKDYYTYCRIYSEYYVPLDKKAHLYMRRFFREDGTTAYEEYTDGEQPFYRFPGRVIDSWEELVGYLILCLNLTSEDVLIIDRSTRIGQVILENAGPARVGCVIHADHFSEGSTSEEYILWNNYYEYLFAQHERIDFYVASTQAQKKLVQEQFRRYKGAEVNVAEIPVGGLAELKYPQHGRRAHSLITASRLATEKHVDWLVEAAVLAREEIPDLTLDIYGAGGGEEELRGLISSNQAQEYIHLCGQQDLTDVYQNYEAYFSASTSEGFGLSLMEATGAGLPIIGFDVRYGNPTFVDDGENGYLIHLTEDMSVGERIDRLRECVVRLFTQADLEAFHSHAYEKAEPYLEKEVAAKWAALLEQKR